VLFCSTPSAQIIFIQTRQIPCYYGTQCPIGVITTIFKSKFNPVHILKTPLHKALLYNPTHTSQFRKRSFRTRTWLNFVSLSDFMSGPSQTCINMCNAYSPNNGANCSANILHSLSLLRFPYFLQLAGNRHFETEQGNKIFPSHFILYYCL